MELKLNLEEILTQNDNFMDFISECQIYSQEIVKKDDFWRL